MGKKYMLCTLSVGVTDAQYAGNAWCERAFKVLCICSLLVLANHGSPG